MLLTRPVILCSWDTWSKGSRLGSPTATARDFLARMEAMWSTGTSVELRRTARRYIPEDRTLQSSRARGPPHAGLLAKSQCVHTIGPATGHLDTGSLGFPLTSSECWGGSQVPSCYCVLLVQPSSCIFIRMKPICYKCPKLSFQNKLLAVNNEIEIPWPLTTVAHTA
jgi:hypothetical protein